MREGSRLKYLVTLAIGCGIAIYFLLGLWSPLIIVQAVASTPFNYWVLVYSVYSSPTETVVHTYGDDICVGQEDQRSLVRS